MDGWARLERKPLVRNGLKKARALRALARSNGRTMADERRSRRFHTKRWTPRTGTDGGSRMRDRERPTTGRAIAGTAPADRLAATGVVHQYDTDSLGKLQDVYHNAHARVQRTSEAPNGHHATRAAQARHALQIASSSSTRALLHCFSRPLRPRSTPLPAVAAHTAYAVPRMCRHVDACAADHEHQRHRPPSGQSQRPHSRLLHPPAAPLALFG